MTPEQISIEQVQGSEIEVVAIQVPGSIEFNYDELKAKVTAEIEPYKTAIVTEDGIQGAKKARAYLNKISATIDDRRKQIKKECMVPYEAFNVKAQELIGIVAEGSKNLDSQIASFEVAVKQQKEAEIREYYRAVGLTSIPFEKIFDQTWLNQTTSTKQWIKAMKDKIEKIEFELDTIGQMALENKESLRAFYLEDLDLKKAKMKYDAQQERIEAARAYEAKKAEEQLIAREEAQDNHPGVQPIEKSEILQKIDEAKEAFVNTPVDGVVMEVHKVGMTKEDAEPINVMLALYGPKHKIETIKQFIKTLDVDFYQVD